MEVLLCRMKMLVGCLVLTCALPAVGSFLVIEDFDLLEIGAIHGQGGWFAGSGTVRVELDPAGGENRVLAVTTDSARVRRAVPFLSGSRRMIFLRFRISEKQAFSLGLSPYSSPTEFSDFGPEVGMSNANYDLRCWDEGAQYEDLITLQPDTWYNLWLFADAGSERYLLWLNSRPLRSADPVSDRLKSVGGAGDFGFRSGAVAVLRTFFIKTGGGSSSVNSGPLYLDDLYIENRGTLNLSNPLLHPGPEIVELSFDEGSNELSLIWTSSAQRLYRITGSAALDDGFPEVLRCGIAGAEGANTTSLRLPRPGLPLRFLRIEEE